MFNVQFGPHCTGTSPTFSTYSAWTSLYRNPPDMFQLVQLGPDHTVPPNMFQLVQLGPHCTWTPPSPPNMFQLVQLDLTIQPYPRHVPTCSTWASLCMEPPPPPPHTHTRCSNFLTMKLRLSASRWLASY